VTNPMNINTDTREPLMTDQPTATETYAIVRTEHAGVFAGIIDKLDTRTRTVHLRQARRIWYWAGAATLSELAVSGTNKPGSCRFPVATPHHQVFGVIEVIPCTPEARTSIEAVPVWSTR